MSDYPADTDQSLDTWLDEWAKMEKVRIARQQGVTLNREGWREETIEQRARRWAPEDKVASIIEREERNAKAR